jgi:hypothetical protein
MSSILRGVRATKGSVGDPTLHTIQGVSQDRTFQADEGNDFMHWTIPGVLKPPGARSFGTRLRVWSDARGRHQGRLWHHHWSRRQASHA